MATKQTEREVRSEKGSRPTFNFLQPIKVSDVPIRKWHESAVTKMPFWSELEEVVDYAAKHGTAPFEEAAEIDLDKYQDVMGKLKRPTLAILTRLRSMIKTRKVKHLDVLLRGNRLIIVGRGGNIS